MRAVAPNSHVFLAYISSTSSLHSQGTIVNSVGPVSATRRGTWTRWNPVRCRFSVSTSSLRLPLQSIHCYHPCLASTKSLRTNHTRPAQKMMALLRTTEALSSTRQCRSDGYRGRRLKAWACARPGSQPLGRRRRRRSTIDITHTRTSITLVRLPLPPQGQERARRVMHTIGQWMPRPRHRIGQYKVQDYLSPHYMYHPVSLVHDSPRRPQQTPITFLPVL